MTLLDKNKDFQTLFNNRLSPWSQLNLRTKCTSCLSSMHRFYLQHKATMFQGTLKALLCVCMGQFRLFWTKRKHEHVTCVFLSSAVSSTAVNMQSCAKVLTRSVREECFIDTSKNFSLSLYIYRNKNCCISI